MSSQNPEKVPLIDSQNVAEGTNLFEWTPGGLMQLSTQTQQRQNNQLDMESTQTLRTGTGGTLQSSAAVRSISKGPDMTAVHDAATGTTTAASVVSPLGIGGIRPQSAIVAQKQQTAHMHYQGEVVRASGTLPAARGDDAFDHNQTRLQAAEREGTATAVAAGGMTAQYEVQNRLSQYAQQQTEAVGYGGGTHNGVSANGGTVQEMAQGAVRTSELTASGSGAPRPQYMVPYVGASIQHYGQKRPAPYMHQMDAGQNAAAAWKYQRINPGAARNSFLRPDASKMNSGHSDKGPTFLNIVENAAAFFEGKPRPEDAVDKERSHERYQFNVDMLEEIFDGPSPPTRESPSVKNRSDVTDSARVDAEPRDSTGESTIRENITRRLGERMLSRTHEERMAEFEELWARYQGLENGQAHVEKGNMRIFQRLERATKSRDVQKIREQYEDTNGVKFFDAPKPIVKTKVDCSLPQLQPCTPARIAQFP